MAVRRDDDEELRDVLANDVTILSDELARWPALIARVASFLFNSLKIFILTEEMYFVIYLPLICSC